MAGRWLRGLAGATAVGACALAPKLAEAQQATTTQQIDVPKFDPAPAGDRFFGVPSAFAPGKLTFHGGAVLDYAHDPLVLADQNGKILSNGRIIEHQLFLHLNVAFSIINRIEINADMPFALVNKGDGTVTGGQFNGSNAFQSPNKAGVGDLRLGARFRIWGEYYDPFQIAIGGYLWTPTASDNAFIGSGVRGQPQVIVGGRVDRFIYSVMLGPEFRQPKTLGALKLGHQFDWGAGVGLLLGDKRQFQVGIETTGGVTLTEAASRSTNAEALIGAKYRIISPIEIGAGVGPGFASGVGTPDVRAVFNIFYTPEVEKPIKDTDGDGIPDSEDACPTVKGVKTNDPKTNGCPPVSDRDHDGIPDDKDACPDEPGPPNEDPKKNGCPLPKDTDGDGIPDDKDACPTEPGPPNEDPKKNGCPIRDRDHDGIPDDEDACPDVPGVKTDDPKTNGCPSDRDKDGIPDDKDACPDEPGPASPDPKKNGCPIVHVTDKEVVILEQVQFDTDKTVIKPVSDPLLDSVAKVLNDHPELTKLEVQGHTDNQGPKFHNKQLSQGRADAVMKALIKRKVDAKRMVAKGYGQDKPIDTNDTPEGRQNNRRVQFVILEKTGKAPEVKQNGPTPAPTPAPKAPPAPAPKAPPAPAPKAPAPKH